MNPHHICRMKSFPIVVIVFRFIAVGLVAWFCLQVINAFLFSFVLRSHIEMGRLLLPSFTTLIPGIILYFIAPVLALLVTRGIDSSPLNDFSPEPPVNLRGRKTAYLMIIGALIVLGGSLVLLFTR